jgi:hypothetical protein
MRSRRCELGLDAVATLVDQLEQRLVHAEIDEHAEEADEGHRHPEFGIELEHVNLSA